MANIIELNDADRMNIVPWKVTKECDILENGKRIGYNYLINNGLCDRIVEKADLAVMINRGEVINATIKVNKQNVYSFVIEYTDSNAGLLNDTISNRQSAERRSERFSIVKEAEKYRERSRAFLSDEAVITHMVQEFYKKRLLNIMPDLLCEVVFNRDTPDNKEIMLQLRKCGIFLVVDTKSYYDAIAFTTCEGQYYEELTDLHVSEAILKAGVVIVFCKCCHNIERIDYYTYNSRAKGKRVYNNIKSALSRPDYVKADIVLNYGLTRINNKGIGKLDIDTIQFPSTVNGGNNMLCGAKVKHIIFGTGTEEVDINAEYSVHGVETVSIPKSVRVMHHNFLYRTSISDGIQVVSNEGLVIKAGALAYVETKDVYIEAEHGSIDIDGFAVCNMYLTDGIDVVASNDIKIRDLVLHDLDAKYLRIKSRDGNVSVVGNSILSQKLASGCIEIDAKTIKFIDYGKASGKGVYKVIVPEDAEVTYPDYFISRNDIISVVLTKNSIVNTRAFVDSTCLGVTCLDMRNTVENVSNSGPKTFDKKTTIFVRKGTVDTEDNVSALCNANSGCTLCFEDSRDYVMSKVGNREFVAACIYDADEELYSLIEEKNMNAYRVSYTIQPE